MKDNKKINNSDLKSNEEQKKSNTPKVDKYGVSMDSEEYLKRTGVASSSEYTGMVPVAMESEAEAESYEEMFNVPVGKKKDS